MRVNVLRERIFAGAIVRVCFPVIVQSKVAFFAVIPGLVRELAS
jgi:hypothetical protein